MGMLGDISGGVSTQIAAADFREAMGREDVRAILFDIDSPGGAVDGTLELAREIYSARGQKPMAALGDGLMASAAVWIGLAADETYLNADTDRAGSIGVVTVHREASKWYEGAGITNTVIAAGKYKAVGNQYEPLTKEGKKVIQDELDYVYSLFVGDVAAFRGVSIETVLEDMADGRVFTGAQAVSAGLVDGVRSRREVIAGLLERAANHKPGVNAQKVGGVRMDMETLRAEHPDLAAALIEEGRAAGFAEGKAAGIEEGSKLGAEAERGRIRDVRGQCIKGHEALIETLMYDGKTTGPEAAVQVLAAEKAAREKAMKVIETESPAPAAASVEPERKPEVTENQRRLNKLFGVSEETFLKHNK